MGRRAGSPSKHTMAAFARVSALRALEAATVLGVAYLCLGELWPHTRSSPFRGQMWRRQQLFLLCSLSLAPLLLGRTHRLCNAGKGASTCVGERTALWVLALVNTVPLLGAALATLWSDEESAAYAAILLDAIGFAAARLARLDLAASLMLSARGRSTWAYEATGGSVGFAEAVNLHRAAGWWCVVQSGLHGSLYIIFYAVRGGPRMAWEATFPVPTEGKLNRRGLVNFYGLLALVAMALLALTSLPRARFYRGFQSVHAGLGLAAVAAALLHDLPILIFAAPGLVDWFAGRYDDLPAGGRRLPARARVIPGTSGPWVELKIELAGPAAAAALSLSSPAGAWVGLSVEEISAEVHPISVAALTSTSMTLVVSGNGGDWCDRLASFASKRPRLWVLVKGPYPSGGWRGSRSRDPPAIMLIAGGTGITGWLPSATAGARVVWTVQQEGDYLALADRLPRSSTVFLTRASDKAAGLEGVGARGEAAGSGSLGAVGHFGTPLVATIAAAVVGIVAEVMWREHVRPALRKDPPKTMWGYTAVARALPVLLILALMAAVVAAGAPTARAGRRLLKRWRRHSRPAMEELGEDCPLRLSRSTGSESHRWSGEEGVAHDVRIGRPDLPALVQEMAMSVQAPILVVAVCGPPGLVESARQAVHATRKSPELRHLRIEFCGTDSRW